VSAPADRVLGEDELEELEAVAREVLDSDQASTAARYDGSQLPLFAGFLESVRNP